MKKAALTTLQLSITLGILWLVFRDPDKRQQMASALRNADPRWLLAGFGVYGLVAVAAIVRWQLLLRVQGIVLSWLRVGMLSMIGLFFNFFVPGGTGGDVVKIFYLLKETPGKRAPALLSVLMDRIIGLFSIVALAGVLIGLRWHWLVGDPAVAKYVWSGLAILGASLGGIGISFFLTGFGLVHKLPARFPGRDRLAELALAYNLYGRAWRPTLVAFLVSIAAHFGYFATFFCAAKSLASEGTHIPTLGELCAIMPIVNTIAAMPISVGGVGVREGLFQVFLGHLAGVAEGVAVVISSTGYVLTLLWGLVGGLVYLLYRPTEHAKLGEIEAQVAAFEHTVAEREIAMEIAEEKKAEQPRG